MAKVEAWFAQDLKKPVPVRYLDGSFFNEDAAGSRIGVRVFSDGEAVTLAGSITGYCVRSDGTTVPVSGTRSSNQAYIDIPQSALSVPGPLTVTIKNTESSVITTLCAVVGIVTQSRTGVQVDPGQTVTDWTNQISAQLQACQTAADNLGSALAVPYPSLTFPVIAGTYTIHNGSVYRAKQYIGTSEEWTSSHWTQVKVCDEIHGLTGTVNALKPPDWGALPFSILSTGRFVDYTDGSIGTFNTFNATDYIPLDGIQSILYKRNGTTYSSTNAGIAFYNASKGFVSGVPAAFNQAASGYLPKLQMVGVPANAAYVRVSIYADTTTYGNFEIYGINRMAQSLREAKLNTFVDMPFTVAQDKKYVVYSDGTLSSFDTLCCTDYIPLDGIGEISYKRTGTTYDSTSAGIAFYDDKKAYVSGISAAVSQAASGYVAGLYTVKVPANAKYARFSMYRDRVTYGFFELYGKNRNAVDIEELRGQLGGQWKGKTWYGYGTSITNTSSEGRYPTYLAQMSGMTFVNKGISGGGIGDLGGYAHGQVYDAVCNITDGKLNADLITLETGANDVRADVPLGTIYDTGRSTLAGCLNDCIRYLQANTNAQICIINSPASTTEPNAANKYYEWADMVRQICDINRVHFLNNNCNMGWAKIADATKGPTYVVDSIHQTNLGGYIMAENLWYQLRNVPLFYTTMPT